MKIITELKLEINGFGVIKRGGPLGNPRTQVLMGKSTIIDAAVVGAPVGTFVGVTDGACNLWVFYMV